MQKTYTTAFVWLALAATLAHSIWCATVGWYNPILDEHSFRQAQTAISAFYLWKGGPFFAYETPVLGPPWSIPFELPVYQWFVAKWTSLSGMAIAQSGRFVGRAFFYATLWPLWAILGHFGVRKEGRVVGLALYLISPMYLFWSRCLLIESTATFCAIAYLAAALRAFSAPKISWPWCAALLAFGVLAGTVKVTTGFAFFFLAGFYFLYCARGALKNKKPRARRLIEAVAAFVVPGIATIAWLHFSDAQKELNPLADFIRSSSLMEWNFGTLHQRVDGKFWNMIFRKVIHDSIGHRTTWILATLCLPFIDKNFRRLALIFFAAFLFVPLTFTNLHIVHNYYWMANGVFLLLFLAFVLEGLFQSKRRYLPAVGYALFVVALALSAREYYHSGYWWQQEVNLGFQDIEAPLAQFVGDQDTVLMVGADWYPAGPWGAKKRTLMLRDDAPVGSQRFLDSLERIKQTPGSLKAVLFCWTLRGDKAAIDKMRLYIRFSERPMYAGTCHIYPTI